MSKTDAHKEFLNKHKLTMLKEAASFVMDHMQNEFPLRELTGSISNYNNFQKLRYHGLIFKVKRGSWGITRNGWAFLRGDLKLPKYVVVQDNKIIERSYEIIGVGDVYHGSEAVTTVFEYFDDMGYPIGARPLSGFLNKRQTSLL